MFWKKGPDQGPGVVAQPLPPTTPSLADRLSAVALRLADLTDIDSVCQMLAEEMGRVGLGSLLIVPRPGGSADAPVYVTYFLSRPWGVDLAAGADPFLVSYAQPALPQLFHQQHRLHLLLPEIKQLIGDLLPQAPMRAQDRGILLPLVPNRIEQGLLIIWGDEERLHPEAVIPFAAFASMLGLVIRVIASVAQQQYQYQTEQETLLDISRILLQGDDLRTILGEAAQIIQRTVGGDLTTIYLYDPVGQAFVPYGAVGWDGGPPLPIDSGSDNGYPNGLSYLYHKRMPILIDDEHAEPRFGAPAFVSALQVRAVVMIPILASNQAVIGAIACSARQENSFGERDVRLLALIANSAAQAIERLRLLQDTQRRVDELAILYKVAQLASEAADEDELLAQVTALIQQKLYPDDFGFLLAPGGGEALLPHPSYYAERGHLPPGEGVRVPLDGSSIASQVFATGLPQRVPDTSKHPASMEKAPGIRSELCVPLKAQDQILGVANAESRTLNFFSPQDERLLLAIASQVASALERIRSHAAEHHRGQQSEVLLRATATLASSLDLNEVLTNILTQLGKMLACDSACIFLMDEQGLLAVAAKGFPSPELIIGHYFSAEQELYQEIRATGKPLLLDDTWADPRFHGWGNTGHIRAWLGVPMHVQGQVIGYITIDSLRPGAFTPADAELAQPFADQAARVIENARMFDLTQQALNVTEILYTTAQALIEATDLEEVLQIAAAQVHSALAADRVVIYLMDLDAQQVSQIVTLAAGEVDAQSPNATQGRHLFETLRAGAEGVALTSRRPVHTNPDPAQPNCCQTVVPLIHRGGSLGLILIQRESHTADLDPREQDLLLAIGNQAATAIKNIQLFTALDAEKSQLEARVAERTQDLALANEQLKALDRLKSEFIANVSHELRTPLTNIKLYVNLLERNSTPSQGKHLAILKEQADQLHQLIETVLDLSRLDAGAGSDTNLLIPVEVGRLVISLVDEMRPQAEAKGVNLEIVALSNRAYVQGDRKQLFQAFRNLILNGLNYTHSGGAVYVQVRRESEAVTVTVEDTGMGIDPQDLPHLFERFFRGQRAVNLNIPGAGLGLSIVKEILQRHKGTVSVTSQLDQGSKFLVRLPHHAEAL